MAFLPISMEDMRARGWEQADFVLIFWDGASKGTRYAIEQCKKLAVAYRVYRKDAASTE